MMNLISFETPPLGRKETAATTTATIKPKAASSSSTCFHGSHLDLSLGISLSHGGSGGDGSCDAAGCGGGKASYSGSRGGGDVGSTSSDCMNANATANTLGAGHGSCHGIVSSGSWTTAFMPSLTGFMHPWSLAARQQKAAAEQDRSLATAPAVTYVPSDARIVPLPAVAVGWPPVHTSRRNLVAAVPRSDAVARLDGPQGAKIAAVEEKNVAMPTSRMVTEARRWPANMFAKVHMDGCSIGRKINLRAHCSYESLSRALIKMTKNFFCAANYSSSSSGEDDCANIDDFIFLYEDFEGDRMLVGDVPWELFLASAKRLYIAQSPATGDHKGPDEAAKRDATEEATNN